MRRNRIPIELPNGNLLVRAAFDAESVTGDGLVEVQRGSAEYEEWARWMQANNITPISAEEAGCSSEDAIAVLAS
jgi:hypothetical protein